MRSRTATRLLSSTALTAATVGALLGAAGPAAAASTVTVTFDLAVSGTSPYSGTPINSVDLRTYDSAGRQVGRECVVQADPRSEVTERRTITPAGGFAVSVPAGGSVEGRASAMSCWDQPTAAPATYRAGTTDATVSWYLHP